MIQRKLNSSMYYFSKFRSRCLSVRNVTSFSPSKILSKENRETCMKKFQSFTLTKKIANSTAERQAAVLIPLCIRDNEVSLIYTLRAADLKTHRGQVSFPGGMRDKGDLSLEGTALRETEEELGIPSEDIDLWGSGNVLNIRSDIKVLPVVGCLNTELTELDQLTLCRSEVEEVFTVKLKDLCKPNFLGHTQFKDTYSTPVFLGGKRRIWGITAVITYMFLRSLLPNDVYKHQIPYIQNITKL